MGLDYKNKITLKLSQFLKEIEHHRSNPGHPGLSLLIFTNFGQVECDLSDPKLSETDPISVIFNGVVDLANITDLPALHIKNAKITPYCSNGPIKIVKDMILFTDQIVGLSFT